MPNNSIGYLQNLKSENSQEQLNLEMAKNSILSAKNYILASLNTDTTNTARNLIIEDYKGNVITASYLYNNIFK